MTWFCYTLSRRNHLIDMDNPYQTTSIGKPILKGCFSFYVPPPVWNDCPIKILHHYNIVFWECSIVMNILRLRMTIPIARLRLLPMILKRLLKHVMLRSEIAKLRMKKLPTVCSACKIKKKTIILLPKTTCGYDKGTRGAIFSCSIFSLS